MKPRSLHFSLALLTLLVAANLAAQAPDIQGLTNGASFDNRADAPPPGPGSIVSIFGTRLASELAPSATTPLSIDESMNVPLETSLGGTSDLSEVTVMIDGVATPQFALIRTPNFDQINVQVPWDIDVTDGEIEVTVSRNDAPTAGSMTFPAADASPGIFTLQSGSGPAIVTNVAFAGGPADVINGSYAVPPGTLCDPPGDPDCTVSEQAAPVGGVVTVWCTGLGTVDVPVANGNIPTSVGPNGFAAAVKPVKVLIGGVEATVLGAALSGEFVGLNQINVVVPGVAPGNALPVQIEMDVKVGGAMRTVTTRPDATMAVRAAP